LVDLPVCVFVLSVLTLISAQVVVNRAAAIELQERMKVELARQAEMKEAELRTKQGLVEACALSVWQQRCRCLTSESVTRRWWRHEKTSRSR
jgi:hypothetical protein